MLTIELLSGTSTTPGIYDPNRSAVLGGVNKLGLQKVVPYNGGTARRSMASEGDALSVDESQGGRSNSVLTSDQSTLLGLSIPENPYNLDLASDGPSPADFSRAQYARKVFAAMKSGYLMKRASKTPMEMSNNLGKIKFLNYVTKRRFFILTGTSLAYHHDHRNLDDPINSKEIHLDGDSTVKFCDMPNLHFGIELVADGKVTLLGAKDHRERQEWQEAIMGVVKKLKGTTRGYMLKLRAGVPTPSPLPVPQAPLSAAVTSGDFRERLYQNDQLIEGKDGSGEWTRKYFMIQGGKLTFHASHSSVLIVQGEFSLPPSTKVETRQGNLLVVRSGSSELVGRSATEEDLVRWEQALAHAVEENGRRRTRILEARAARGEDPLVVMDDMNLVEESYAYEDGVEGFLRASEGSGELEPPRGASFSSRNGSITVNGLGVDEGGGTLLKGDLLTRPKDGEGPWKASHYVLEKGRFLVYEDRHHLRPKQVHKISPGCSVFETNLRAYSFEVVVRGQVLHLQGSSFEDSLRWIATLKAAINNSPSDTSDPLLLEALKLEDTFYYADFETKQPLGVVLERSKEWAIVKLANPDLSQVSVGSALASVNGVSVVLRAYEETISMLTGWKPPLNLIFRRGTVKEGWLKKQTFVKKKSFRWRNVWMDLKEGKLSYYKDGPGGLLLGVMPMMGSAVTLVPPAEVGGNLHCMKVIAGVTSLIVQGPSHDDILSWASHLYQASAIANGGGYLLDQERDQERAYEEERRRRWEQETAELDRIARSHPSLTQQPETEQPAAIPGKIATVETSLLTSEDIPATKEEQAAKKMAGVADKSASKFTVSLGAGANAMAGDVASDPEAARETELKPGTEAEPETEPAPEASAPEVAVEREVAAEPEVEIEPRAVESRVGPESMIDTGFASHVDADDEQSPGEETFASTDTGAVDEKNTDMVQPVTEAVEGLGIANADEAYAKTGMGYDADREGRGAEQRRPKSLPPGLQTRGESTSAEYDGDREEVGGGKAGARQSVMDLIREREAAARARQRPVDRQESVATRSPSFAAVRRRKQIDTRAWGGTAPNPATAPASPGDAASRVPNGDGETSGGAEAGAESEGNENRAPFSRRAPVGGKPVSPSLAAALTRKSLRVSPWAGEASDASSASAARSRPTMSRKSTLEDSMPPASSTGGDRVSREAAESVGGNTRSMSASPPVVSSGSKLPPPVAAPDDGIVAGEVITAPTLKGGAYAAPEVAKSWDSDGSPGILGYEDLSGRSATNLGRGEIGDNIEACFKDGAEGGQPGGPRDEKEVLKWVRSVTGARFNLKDGAHSSLRSGITLCRLMSKLRPGVRMPSPSEATLPYKQMANICVFLRACRSIGLGESVLFETADLYEGRNIPKVVVSLATLGASAPTLCPEFKGPYLDVSAFSWNVAADADGAGDGDVPDVVSRADVGELSQQQRKPQQQHVASSSRTTTGKRVLWSEDAGSESQQRAGSFKARSSGSGEIRRGISQRRPNGRAAQGVSSSMWRRRAMNHEPLMSPGDSDDEDKEQLGVSGEALPREDQTYDGCQSTTEVDEEETEDHGVGGSRRGSMTAFGGLRGLLTEDVLRKAFNSVEMASQSGGLDSHQFSALWRSLSGGQQDLYREISMFHRFNTSGQGVVSFEEFKSGFRRLEMENGDEHQVVLRKLHAWSESQTVSF